MNKRTKIGAGITAVVIALSALVYLSSPGGERTATIQAVDAESVLAIGCENMVHCLAARAWYDVEIRDASGSVVMSSTTELAVTLLDEPSALDLPEPPWPVAVTGERWVRVRVTGPYTIFEYHHSLYGDADDCNGVDLCGYYRDSDGVTLLERDERKFSHAGDQTYLYLPFVLRKRLGGE